MNDLNQNKLYSVTEAANQLKIGKKALYTFIYLGKIGTLTIGKRRKIPQQEIEKFILEKYYPSQQSYRSRNHTN